MVVSFAQHSCLPSDLIFGEDPGFPAVSSILPKMEGAWENSSEYKTTLHRVLRGSSAEVEN